MARQCSFMVLGMYILTASPAVTASEIDCYGETVRIGKADERSKPYFGPTRSIMRMERQKASVYYSTAVYQSLL